MKKLLFISLILTFAFVVIPKDVKALGQYNLISIQTEANLDPMFAGSSVITISGNVTPGIPLKYKYRKASGGALNETTSFPSQPNGDFIKIIGDSYSNFTCGETYRFWLYDSTNNSVISVILPDGYQSQYFDSFMYCGDGASGAGNIFAPSSAQAESIHGVNWGNVTTTDTKITISGAKLIPFISTGPKGFFVENGLGVPGGPYEEAINQTLPIVRNYPYSIPTIPITTGLLPATDYYVNIKENPIPGQAVPWGELYLYKSVVTGPVSNANTHWTWDAPTTSLNVSGRLVASNGLVVENREILIRILSGPNPGDAEVASFAATTTSTPVGSTDTSTAGAFNHTFTGLVPGTTYYILIQDFWTDHRLINPISVTIPSEPGTNAGGSGLGGTLNPDPNCVHGGLICCDGGPQDPCDFNDLIGTINRVIDFLIFYIAFPLVAIVIAWAGILLLTSGGNTSKRDEAKAMIGKILIGLIVALLCWVIIKLLLMVLGYQGPLLQVFGLDENYNATGSN